MTSPVFNLPFEHTRLFGMRSHCYVLVGIINWEFQFFSSTVFPKESVKACDASFGGGWMIFHFRLFKSILFFLNWISSFFFHLLHCTNLMCLLLLYILLGFNTLFSCFFSSLPRDQSRDVTLRLGVFIFLWCTSFLVCILLPATIITTMQ